MKKLIFSLFFLFLLCLSSLAQTVLAGLVKDFEGATCPNVNILVYSHGEEILLAYGISDINGNFSIELTSSADSLKVETQSISYRTDRKVIANASQKIDFVLSYDTRQLDAFTVIASPIEKKGDTLSYLVSSFAGKEDRSVEDVLKKMPGIEVSSNGQIKYQGVPIQKFYVEGLDLMDGGYGVISGNLPHESVSTIEIYEDNQPIRVLEDLVSSQQASLNVKLKRSIVTTGTAKLSAGFSPFLWDVNATPMSFTKSFQFVASYQTNNIGHDYSRDVNTLTLQELQNAVERPDNFPSPLDIQSNSTLSFDNKHYLDNTSHLLSFNGLVKFTGDSQLRANFYYLNDVQKTFSSVKESIFLSNDTITTNRNIDNSSSVNALKGSLTYTDNSKRSFINNKLNIYIDWNSKNGIITGQNAVSQNLKNPFRSISNDFASVTRIGTHLIEFNSYISYDDTPNSISVEPGIFADVLNDSVEYQSVTQNYELNRFFSHHSLKYIFGWKNIVFTPCLGHIYEYHDLDTDISIINFNNKHNAGDDFINKQHSKKSDMYAQMAAEYKLHRIIINAALPLRYCSLSVSDKINDETQTLDGLFFSPYLSVNYILNGFWKAYATWSYKSRPDDWRSHHGGFILYNSKLISQNDNPLSLVTTQKISINLSYRNAITSFFNKLLYIYTVNQYDYINNSLILPNGTAVSQTFDKRNNRSSHLIIFESSKYFSAIKSSIRLNASFQSAHVQSLLNNEIYDIENRVLNIKPEVMIRFTSWLNLEYLFDAVWFKSIYSKNEPSIVPLLKHKMKIVVFPFDNHVIKFSNEYYQFEKRNFVFSGLAYRYTIPKSKIDFELNWNNIFNLDTYIDYNINSYYMTQTIYYLRSMQLLLSVRFSF